MPWLDLLAENCDDAVAVLSFERLAEARIVDGLEDLGGEGAYVVEVCRKQLEWCE